MANMFAWMDQPCTCGEGEREEITCLYCNGADEMRKAFLERDARIAELEKNARRYLFFRANHKLFGVPLMMATDIVPDDLDAAIDEAMSNE